MTRKTTGECGSGCQEENSLRKLESKLPYSINRSKSESLLGPHHCGSYMQCFASLPSFQVDRSSTVTTVFSGGLVQHCDDHIPVYFRVARASGHTHHDLRRQREREREREREMQIYIYIQIQRERERDTEREREREKEKR